MINWLTSKVTQVAALIGAVVFVIWRVFVAGKSSAQNEQKAAEADAYKTRSEVDDAIDAMDRADIDRELDRWVQ